MDVIKILVVDDHALFRRGIVECLKNQPGFEIVGEALDGFEAIKLAKQTKPNVILMDLNMPYCNGLDATKILQTQLPEAKIMILTISDNESDLFSAMHFGARGFILKNVLPEELIQNILQINQGGVIISPLVASSVLKEFQKFGGNPDRTTPTDLSPREEEVLNLVATGATNKQIAEALVISENTVKTHLRSILDKLHLVNRSQAAAYAVKNFNL